jgi:hypothetical protein
MSKSNVSSENSILETVNLLASFAIPKLEGFIFSSGNDVVAFVVKGHSSDLLRQRIA